MSRYIAKVWRDLLNVKYISPSPGVKYRFEEPSAPRADTDPTVNQQPWYHGSNFGVLDPSRGIIPEVQRKARGRNK